MSGLAGQQVITFKRRCGAATNQPHLPSDLSEFFRAHRVRDQRHVGMSRILFDSVLSSQNRLVHPGETRRDPWVGKQRKRRATAIFLEDLSSGTPGKPVRERDL